MIDKNLGAEFNFCTIDIFRNYFFPHFLGSSRQHSGPIKDHPCEFLPLKHVTLQSFLRHDVWSVLVRLSLRPSCPGKPDSHVCEEADYGLLVFTEKSKGARTVVTISLTPSNHHSSGPQSDGCWQELGHHLLQKDVAATVIMMLSMETLNTELDLGLAEL